MNNRAMRKIRQPQFPSGIGGCFVFGRRLMVFGGTIKAYLWHQCVYRAGAFLVHSGTQEN